VTGDVDEIYLRRLETKRNDHAKLSKAEKKAGKGNDSGAQIADINNDI
jgi:hypothetical protein